VPENKELVFLRKII